MLCTRNFNHRQQTPGKAFFATLVIILTQTQLNRYFFKISEKQYCGEFSVILFYKIRTKLFRNVFNWLTFNDFGVNNLKSRHSVVRDLNH